MTAAQARILGEISGLLRSVADSLPPGEEITMETIFIDDLEMNSLQMANLTGRIAAFYGFKADLVPFYADREAGPFHGLRVGELVDYLAGVLGDAEAAAVPGRLGAEGRRASGITVTQPTVTSPPKRHAGQRLRRYQRPLRPPAPAASSSTAAGAGPPCCPA